MIRMVPFISTPATAPQLKQDRAAIVARSVISGIAFGILSQVAMRSKHYGFISLTISFLAYQITSHVETWRATQALNNLAVAHFFGNDEPASKRAMNYLADSKNDAALEIVNQRLQDTAEGTKHALRLCELICQARFSRRIPQIRKKLEEALKNSSAAVKYQALLIVLRHRSSNTINIDTGVKVEDFLNTGNRVPKEVLDSINIYTFNSICSVAKPSESNFNVFWGFVLRFDDLSNSALHLFERLLENRPIGKNDLIQWCMQDAIEHGKPEIVASLIEHFYENLDTNNPETVKQYWLHVKDARTARLLKENFPEVLPTTGLLNEIVSRDAASYDQPGFTQETHLLSVPRICLMARHSTRDLCTRLGKQSLLAFIRADQLLSDPTHLIDYLKFAGRATFEALCARSNEIDFTSSKYADTLNVFWDLFCKFDYCDETENSLFRKMIAQFDSTSKTNRVYITQSFEHAVGKCCPGVVRYLLRTNRIKPADFHIYKRFQLWAYLENKETGALLQLYGFDLNEHPQLLDVVISRDENDPRAANGFTPADHLSVLFRAGINKEWVEKAIREWEGKGKDILIQMMKNYLQPQAMENN